MKVNDSGMPEETYWNSLFDIESVVDWLGLCEQTSKVVEIGCGYGTFTVPVAEKVDEVTTFDIEPAMIETAKANIQSAGLSNVTFVERDILEQGTGLEANSTDLVLLFNILHFSEKNRLLKEAAHILKKGGIVAIIHWRKDIPTPRGPANEIRPDERQILSASEGLNLQILGESELLKPYHWGLKLIKQ
ncbi:MAG: hypothetical protein ISEC1_P1834 [Thiomicrorhabdus sp.]|nr:MAG: hypothetical protein ISEC1_P1834 [Thiomicrorhabdus sp.]